MSSFKNIKLADLHIKARIFKYLYSKINKKNFKHQEIQNEADLKAIKDGDYVVCPKIKGTRSFIMFIKLNLDDKEVYYAVNFPKYNMDSKNNQEKEQMIYPIDIKADSKIYDGTILEGIYIKDHCQKLIVDEVYMLSGDDQITRSKIDRLHNLNDLIDKKLIQNSDTFEITTAPLYDIEESSLKNLFNGIKKDNLIQEIIFYPKVYGKTIYRYTIVDEDKKEYNLIVKNFLMKKTTMSDVYQLLDVESEEKVAMASIPDMLTSKECKKWFQENKLDMIGVQCLQIITSEGKEKWKPISYKKISEL